MNRKKQLLYIVVSILLVFQMAFSSVAFAEGEGDETDNGTPSIGLINGPIFDVTPGRENRVVIRLKNASSFSARSLVVQPTFPDVANTPFRLTFENNGNRVSVMNVRMEKDITMLVTVDKTAPSKNYPITLNYTYFNSVGTKYTGSDTIYLSIKNDSSQPSFTLEDIALSPKAMNPGDTATLSAQVRNQSLVDMLDVEVLLDGLNPEGISIAGGMNGKRFPKIGVGSAVGVQFQLVAGSEMNPGSYPVTFKIKYKDDTTKEYEISQQYYVGVGGTVSGKPTLEIRNMVEPSGTYGVNQNFTIQFQLANLGESEAKNIKVTAAGVGDGAVVPKSASIKNIKSLKSGENTALSFDFAATSASKSQNYPVEFTVEYGSGSTPTIFKQYAGVNVSNPDAEDEDGKGSKPKIIISQYECDPIIVMAGSEFDLKMTLLNTHKEKSVKNIKMFLTLSEETASDTAKTGNIFTPVNSSNTFYFDSISAKGTVDKALRLFVVPDAQPKTYTLTVNFEYEDEKGTEYTGNELLGINVKQVTDLSVDDYTLPPSVEMGMPMMVSFGYYNTGKVGLNNLMIKIEGDVETPAKSTFMGNLEPGESGYYEGQFSAKQPGELPVTIIISYDDPTGETIEKKKEFIVQVTEPMMLPEGEGMEGQEPPKDGLTKKNIIGMIGMSIVVLGGMFFVVQRKKNYQEINASLAEDEEE